MKQKNPISESIELDMTGSSTFGRSPKVLASRTFNMIEADGWLTEYGGYKKIIELLSGGKGRGIFSSIPGNFMVAVVNENIYIIRKSYTLVDNQPLYDIKLIGAIFTSSGDVFIDENNVSQIGICDKTRIYVYDYNANTFSIAVLPEGFLPGYLTYQNGRFATVDYNAATWLLSAPGNALNWFPDEPMLGKIDTKPEVGRAIVRFPGRGNLIGILGKTVLEFWTDVGGAIFPYQKSSSTNGDYGIVNAATLAASDKIITWLGINEKSGPVIMYSTGDDVETISTDGINFRFEQLVNPEASSGFFVKLSGHLFYQLNFYDPADNFSVVYDFTSKKFYDVTDEKMDHHIARKVCFFDNDYYFVSFNDGNLYQLSAELSTYDYGTFSDGSPHICEIPRVRVNSNIRLKNASHFVVNNLNFTIEQGNDPANNFNNDAIDTKIILSEDGIPLVNEQSGAYLIVDNPSDIPQEIFVLVAQDGTTVMIDETGVSELITQVAVLEDDVTLIISQTGEVLMDQSGAFEIISQKNINPPPDEDVVLIVSQDGQIMMDQTGNYEIIAQYLLPPHLVDTDIYHPRIAISLSRDGGISFGRWNEKDFYLSAHRVNKLNWWNLGMANDLVVQVRFFGLSRWKVTNGEVNIYQ